MAASRGTAWSGAENVRIVAEYFEMWRREQEGVPYNKAAINRRLQEATGRTREAIEYKHANISAILRDLAIPPIDGYKPRANYQGALRQAIEEFLSAHLEIDDLLKIRAGSAPDEKQIEAFLSLARQVSVPARAKSEVVKDRAVRSVFRTDYAALEARNSRLGRAGEEYAFQIERKRLEEAGRSDLARKVEWVSRSRGDGLGFDVLTFDPSAGREVRVEVKTTNAGRYTPFFVTRNELRVSTSSEATYRLFRLFHFDRDPRFFLMDGALERTCSLAPEVYRGRPL